MRPRDDDGNLLRPPHLRLDMQPFHEAALFAMDADPRSPALPIKRKLAMIDKAVDHVVDGDAAPKWVWAKDKDRPENRFLSELWGIAVKACRRVKVVAP